MHFSYFWTKTKHKVVEILVQLVSLGFVKTTIKMSTKRLEQLMGFLKGSPNEPFILFAIAKEYEGMNNTSEALKYYLQLEENSPNYVGTYYHLGKLYEHLGEDKKAFFTYKKGMQKAQEAGDQHSLSELAGAKLELGDEDDFED